MSSWNRRIRPNFNTPPPAAPAAAPAATNAPPAPAQEPPLATPAPPAAPALAAQETLVEHTPEPPLASPEILAKLETLERMVKDLDATIHRLTTLVMSNTASADNQTAQILEMLRQASAPSSNEATFLPPPAEELPKENNLDTILQTVEETADEAEETPDLKDETPNIVDEVLKGAE